MPASRVLEAGQSQVFKITFVPDERPRLYDFDIECEITNDTKLVLIKVTDVRKYTY